MVLMIFRMMVLQSIHNINSHLYNRKQKQELAVRTSDCGHASIEDIFDASTYLLDC